MKHIKSIYLLLGTIFLLACNKNSIPLESQIAEPVKMGLIKGPLLISGGKIYFLEDKAVYKPNFTSFVRKTEDIVYSEIDTVTKGKFNILLPNTANVKMKDGKKYKVNIPFKRKYLIQTLNNLKQ